MVDARRLVCLDPKKEAPSWQYPRPGILPELGASTLGLLGTPSGGGPILAASALFPGRTSQGGRIVGQPQLVEGLLIVADLSGRFLALDPVTGRPCGPGRVLQGSVAPAASPVAFGPGQVFAPLTDGTVLLLSLDELRPRPR